MKDEHALAIGLLLFGLMVIIGLASSVLDERLKDIVEALEQLKGGLIWLNIM